MSINQIVTPLDSAVLDNKEQYSVYFKIVTHAFDKILASLDQENICSDIETSFIKQYCELLTYSLEAFRVKYLFDDEERMKIDLTESGFPNALEFRYLINDLELKNEHLKKLPKVSELKEEFLELILKRKKEISNRQLYQAASIIYYTSVEKKFIYKRFVQGRIVKTNTDDATYLVSWSFYDVTYNRPFVCFMYFNLYKEKLEDYTQKIYEVLEAVANRDINLDTMAYAIDKKLPNLLPKKLKKVDLGPLHNVFAKDELQITHTLLESIIDKTLDLSTYAISLAIEEIVSKGNFTEGTFFNKQYLQVWDTVEKQTYVFAPHRAIQVFYDKIPEIINSLTQEPIEIPVLKL